MMTFETFLTKNSKLCSLYKDYKVVIDVCDKYGTCFQTYSCRSIENMDDNDKNCCTYYKDHLIKKYFLDDVRSELYIKIIPFNSYLMLNEPTVEVFSYYSYKHENSHRYEFIHQMMNGGFCFSPSTNEVIKEIINQKYGIPLKIENTISNDPATIVFWNDGSKTVVKADDEDSFDLEKGILYAALKKRTNKKEYDNILRTIDSAKGDDLEKKENK